MTKRALDGDEHADGRANIFDVAKHAGVSFVSVSRVFNNHPNVSQKMREKVMASASAVRYKPKLVTRPKVIALLVGNPSRYAAETDMNRICCRIVLRAADQNFLTRILPLHQVEQLARHALDGVIEVELGEASLYSQQELPRFPVVLTQHRTLHPAWSSVTIDYENEGADAFRHLVELGHRRIAFLLESFSPWTAQYRIRGIQALRQTLRLPEDSCVFLDASTIPLLELEGVLRQERATALVSFCSDLTPSLLDYLFNHSRLRIPSGLSLLCLDNSPLTAHYHPRVCTIRQNLEELADHALDQLIVHMTRKSKNTNILVRSRIEPHSTCVPAP